MLVMQVAVHVKREYLEAFKAATKVNAEASLKEPGIARFDVLQQREDPSRFLLIEAYRTPEAPAAHKATAHYAVWRDRVAPMMAEPRVGTFHDNLFPYDGDF